jgi:hypothetical protein
MWELEPKPLLTPGGRQDISKILYCDRNPADILHQQLQSVYPKNVASRTVRQITFPMDQRSIALYLSMKGLSATLIHQELVDTFGPEAAAYSTVTWYLREARFAGQNEEVPIESADYNRLESQWAPYHNRTSKGTQIQRLLLYERNTPRNQELARATGSW